MESKELEQIKREIDIKLATEIAKNVVHEMSKMENAKSNVKIFSIISILFAIICTVCVAFTSLVGYKLLYFLDNIVIEQTTEDVVLDSYTGTESYGDAITVYNSGNNSNVSNSGNITNNGSTNQKKTGTGGEANGKSNDED